MADYVEKVDWWFGGANFGEIAKTRIKQYQ